MAGSGKVQAIEGFGGNVDGAVKPNGALGAPQIVINGFWDRHQLDAPLLGNVAQNRQATVTPDAN